MRTTGRQRPGMPAAGAAEDVVGGGAKAGPGAGTGACPGSRRKTTTGEQPVMPDNWRVLTDGEAAAEIRAGEGYGPPGGRNEATHRAEAAYAVYANLNPEGASEWNRETGNALWEERQTRRSLPGHEGVWFASLAIADLERRLVEDCDCRIVLVPMGGNGPWPVGTGYSRQAVLIPPRAGGRPAEVEGLWAHWVPPVPA